MATTAIAALGAGSSAVSAGSGLISSISDPIFRAQELDLSRKALQAQVDFNNKSLALAAASPFLNALASASATENIIRVRQQLMREAGASRASVDAIAAGQEGVYVNGMIQPIHYDNSMYQNSRTSRPGVTYSAGVNQLSLPNTTINKTTNNNITRNYEAGYRFRLGNAPQRNRIPEAWRTTSNTAQNTVRTNGTYNSAASGINGSYTVNNTITSWNSAASGNTGHYTVNGTARSSYPSFTVGERESTRGLLNNWYQFGFLAPGGTRL